MSKLNPVMLNKPKPKERYISVEEFMETIPPEFVVQENTVINNLIEENIVTDDTSLEPILDSTAVAEGLDAMATDIDGITTAPALEAYKRMFTQLTTLTGHPVASMEDFKATKGGVRKFAKLVRTHADDIRVCISIAQESYAEKVDQSVDKSMANYKQAISKLNAIKNTMTSNKDRIVLVNQKEAWQLFHMRNELMDLSEFGMELKGISDLEKLIDEGINNVKNLINKGKEGKALSKFLNILLMNNTTVKVKDGRAHFEEIEAPKPSREWTARDWPLHLAYSLVNKEYKGGKGEEQTAYLESTETFGKVIESVKKLAPVMEKIARDTDELVAFIGEHNAETRPKVEKMAAPVLELAANTIKHVTEVTYGFMKMFGRMEKGE